jgi:hypothetical protein
MVATQSMDILSIFWACQLQGFIVSLCSTMEVYCLMLLAIERYYFIVKKEPLTQSHIHIMILIGWLWIGLLALIPIWVDGFEYRIQPSQLYCNIASWKPALRPFLIPVMIQLFLIIHTIGYCYFKINRETRIWAEFKQKPQENILTMKTQGASMEKSNVTTSESTQCRVCKILVTCVILAGWTLIAWLPISLCYVYSLVTSQPVPISIETTCVLIWNIAMLGDVIILAMVDKRWTAAIRYIALKR